MIIILISGWRIAVIIMLVWGGRHYFAAEEIVRKLTGSWRKAT